MTRKIAYAYVNAFTQERFGGNPCLVFFKADAIDEATRIAITRESRLSECAFLQAPTTGADFAARYYLASGPIPMAGHPTVATVVAMMDAGIVAPGASFRLEVGAGVIDIETSTDGEVAMTQLAPEFGAFFDPAEIAAVYGLTAADIVAPPQMVSTGTGHVIALLRDPAALSRARVDEAAMAALQARIGGASHPFLCALADEGTEARMLLEPPNPPEDPFTGSATGEMAAYLWRHGLIQSPRFIARQGRFMDRPGAADVEVLGPPEAITGVRVAGPGVVLMRGEIELD